MPSARLLSTPGIFLGEEKVEVPRGKTSTLLYYLAYQHDWVSREDILYLFWPDTEELKARNNLRQLLSAVRKLPFTDDLETNKQSLRWRVPSDSQVFKEAVENKQWTKAVETYHGPLLCGFRVHRLPEFESWLELERAELLRIFKDAALQLSQDFMSSERYKEAAEVLEKVLEQDPFDEVSFRHYLKAVFLSEGQDKAKQALGNYHKALAQELEAEPEAATLELFEELKGLTQDSALSPQTVAVSMKTLENKPLHNLPIKLTPFVGRDQERAQLADYLANPTCKLVTLLGPGGMGKTRLAIAVAEEHLGSFEHGVWFVAFDALENPDAMLYPIAEALSFRFYGQDDPKAQLLTYLSNKDMLLVLDNLEHLLAGTPLITELLENAPKLKVLATSREVLNLQAEHVFEVRGLNLEQKDETSDARRLFIQSAQKRKRDLDSSEDNTAAINTICNLVEGMPLAIELAASWLSVLTPQAIAQELEQGLGILEGQTRDTPRRHQSIKGVFDYSWNLLSNREQDILAKLAVFRGGFTRDAAKQVTGATLPILASLVNKSFLRVLPNGRYDRHPLVFEFCLEKLAERDNAQRVYERHAEYFLELAEEAEPHLEGPKAVLWLEQLDYEHDNLRAVLAWVLKNNQTELGLRMVGSLELFWNIRCYEHEGKAWVEKCLQLPGASARTKLRAKALASIGYLVWRQFDYASAANYFEESLSISRELADWENMPPRLNGLAHAKGSQGDQATAQALYEESLAISRRLSNEQDIAHAIVNLGELSLSQGDYFTAKLFLEEGLRMFQKQENKTAVSEALFELAEVARQQRDFDTARSFHENALALSRELGDKQDIAHTTHHLGHVARDQGDFNEAKRLYEASLRMFQELGIKVGIANAFTNLGVIAHEQGDWKLARSHLSNSLSNLPNQMYYFELACSMEGWALLKISEELSEHAARLLGCAERLREGICRPHPPSEREGFERKVEAARRWLGETAFSLAWAEGGQLSKDEAIELALSSS